MKPAARPVRTDRRGYVRSLPISETADYAAVTSSGSVPLRKNCGGVGSLLRRIVARADSAGYLAWRFQPKTSVTQLNKL